MGLLCAQQHIIVKRLVNFVRCSRLSKGKSQVVFNLVDTDGAKHRGSFTIDRNDESVGHELYDKVCNSMCQQELDVQIKVATSGFGHVGLCYTGLYVDGVLFTPFEPISYGRT